MILLSSVLVAIDFGDTSKAALVYGRKLARAFGGRLHLLHVAEEVSATAEMDPTSVGDLQKRVEGSAARELESLLTSDERDGEPGDAPRQEPSHQVGHGHFAQCEPDEPEVERHGHPEEQAQRPHVNRLDERIHVLRLMERNAPRRGREPFEEIQRRHDRGWNQRPSENELSRA